MNKLTRGSSLTLLLVLIFAFSLLSACGNKNNNNSANSASPSASAPAESAAASLKESPKEAPKEKKELRIGFQKYGTVNILKAKGTLEPRLEAEGYNVSWIEFPGGPQLLEALNVGSIDFGHTGEAPPIFAQAADAPLVYLAHEPASPTSEGILVPKDSPIKTIADLKGKKVALNKGSNVHYLLVKALEKAGLKYDDIETVFLKPGDARPAFENGSVDAWVIWDPFLAAAQTATGGTIIADGTDLVANHEFYLASRGFAEKNKPAIDVILDELNHIDLWAKDNIKEVAAELSPQLGIDVESLELASGRRPYGLTIISDEIIAAQQQIADTFYSLKLIPKEIKVADAVLK